MPCKFYKELLKAALEFMQTFESKQEAYETKGSFLEFRLEIIMEIFKGK